MQMSAPEVAARRKEAEAKLASDLATYDRLKDASATPGVVSKNDVNIAAQTVEGEVVGSLSKGYDGHLDARTLFRFRL